MNAAQRATDERQWRSLKAAQALIAERGLGQFATFLECPEGDFFPNGMESMSGCAVFEDGREFYFWMDWDAEEARPRLGTWEEVTERPAGVPRGEYADALAAVGLLDKGRLRDGVPG